MNTTKKTLTHIDPLSAAKVSGLVTFAIAAVFGAIALVLPLLSIVAEPQMGAVMFVFSLLMVIFMLGFYGLMGFILGYFYAWVYNKTFSHHGGVRISLGDTPTSSERKETNDAAGKETSDDASGDDNDGEA